MESAKEPQLKLTLSQLMGENAWITAELEKREGELSPELEDHLKVLVQAIPEKIDRTNGLIRWLEDSADLINEKADRIKKISRGLTKVANYLRTNVKQVMIDQKMIYLNGNESRFILKHNKKKELLVECTISELPEEFVDEELKMVVVTSINQDKLRAALEAGEVIPGCSLQERYALQPVPDWDPLLEKAPKKKKSSTTTKEITDGKEQETNVEVRA